MDSIPQSFNDTLATSTMQARGSVPIPHPTAFFSGGRGVESRPVRCLRSFLRNVQTCTGSSLCSRFLMLGMFEEGFEARPRKNCVGKGLGGKSEFVSCVYIYIFIDFSFLPRRTQQNTFLDPLVLLCLVWCLCMCVCAVFPSKIAPSDLCRVPSGVRTAAESSDSLFLWCCVQRCSRKDDAVIHDALDTNV